MIIKDQKEIFWGDDEYINYLYCDNDFTYIYVNIYQIVYIKYVQIIACQLYSYKNKTSGKKVE